MVEMAVAACEHLLAHNPEPRGDRRWNRSLAQHLLCASRGRCRFVTHSADASGLHFVSAGCPHVVADSGQVPSLQYLLAAMAGAWFTAAWSMEDLSAGSAPGKRSRNR
jgi:hypothetical protein